MDKALDFIKKGDRFRPSLDMKELVDRVETANFVLHSGSPINKCMQAARVGFNFNSPPQSPRRSSNTELQAGVQNLDDDMPHKEENFELHLPTKNERPAKGREETATRSIKPAKKK